MSFLSCIKLLFYSLNFVFELAFSFFYLLLRPHVSLLCVLSTSFILSFFLLSLLCFDNFISFLYFSPEVNSWCLWVKTTHTFKFIFFFVIRISFKFLVYFSTFINFVKVAFVAFKCFKFLTMSKCTHMLGVNFSSVDVLDLLCYFFLLFVSLIQLLNTFLLSDCCKI